MREDNMIESNKVSDIELTDEAKILAWDTVSNGTLQELIENGYSWDSALSSIEQVAESEWKDKEVIKMKKTRTDTMTMLDGLKGMSNFNGEAAEGIEEGLKNNPNTKYAQHSAYDFCGYFFWDGKQFVEEIWVYGNHVDTLSANTLEDLMVKVNDVYGWN